MVFRRRKLTNRVQAVVEEVLHLLQRESQSGIQNYSVSAVQAARLEERVLMSASPMAIVAEGTVQAVDTAVAVMETGVDLTDGANVEFDVLIEEETSPDTASDDDDSAIVPIVSDAEQEFEQDPAAALNAQVDSGPELIVIDYRVQDADALLEHLLRDGRDVRLLRLDVDTEGLQQITEKLRQVGNVSAIHLLTHGRDGEILLGSTRLNSTTLAQHAPELLSWQHSLTANADLLIYGCDVAESVEGRDFLDSLSALTGADIAASTDATGGSAESGDWILEYTSGQIDRPGIFSANVMDSWQHRLAVGGTITVTTTNDVVDGTTTSIAALLENRGADGLISLREAILAANSNADVDEIILGTGEYRIQMTGKDETGLVGDFDIRQGVTIRGAGSGSTIIRAGSIDRVFDVRASASATIIGVTVTGGDTSEDGGGIRVSRNATLTLSHSVLSGNSTTKSGGALFNDGTATLTNVTVSANEAGTDGGGISNSGVISLNNVTLSGNMSARGGGLHHDGVGSTLVMTSVTVSSNTATNQGGGIYSGKDASLLNVTLANNEAGSAGGGLYVHTTNVTVTARNTIFSGNQLTNGVNSNVSGAVSSLGNNLDSDGTAALNQPTDISGVDPRLQALANNGGFTQTHALAADSLAIDAGSSAAAPATDQRGFARDLVADIGAYEFDREFLATGQFHVNSTTSADQVTSAETRGSQNAIARDHAGNYVVVWSSNAQDGSGWGVYGRRFNANGQPLSDEFRVNTVTSDSQQWASVAADRNGNFVVTWTSSNQDGTTESVYARRFSAAGIPLSGEFRVNTTATGAQKNSTIAMNSAGQFVIVWQGEGPGDTSGVFFRRYAADGTAIDSTDKRANASSTGTQINPGVAIDGTGSIVVLWQDTSKLYFQKILTSEGDINPSTGRWSSSQVEATSLLGTIVNASIAMTPDGNFVVVYREQSVLGLLNNVGAHGYNADGTTRFSPIQVTSGAGASPSIAMAHDGQFIVTWHNIGDGDGTGIYARKYLANGSANGAAFVVNQHTAGNQSQSSLTMMDPDNFVVVWSGASATDTSGISIRQFGTDIAQALPAQNDYVTTSTNTDLNIDVVANDARGSSGVAVLLDVSRPVNGTASITADGTISYSPNTSYAGDDSLSYLISDGTDGTSHYWSLGGHAVDSVGSADGVLNGTTSVTGSFGTGLQFNKTSDYVRLPDFAYTSSFTVSFDFKIDDNTGSLWQYLYSHGASDTTNSLQVLLGETEVGADANVLKTYFGDTNDAYSTTVLNTNIASLIGDGRWHTYTLVVDKVSGTQVYIDGTLRVSDATRGGDAFNPTGDIYLGVRSDLNSARYYGGQLDSVRIIDRALTATEVGSLDAGNSPSATSIQSTATVYVTVQNAEPIVSMDGPYQSSVGLPVTFSGSGTSDLNNDTLTYEWDFNYDGATFNTDATGMTVSKTWAELQAGGTQVGTNSIALKVTDSRGAETVAITTHQVLANAAPTAISLSNYVIPGAQAGAVVGNLTTTDSTAGDIHAYSVTDSRFEVVSGQLKLKAGQSVNRDTETSVSMDITARDLAGNQLTRTFVLMTGHGPVVARDNVGTTNENTSLTIAAPGVLFNDDVPSGVVVSGALLDFNAAQDTNGDLIWQNTSAVTGFGLTLGTGVTRNAMTPSNHYGILSAFDFNGSATSGAFSNTSLAALPGNPTDGAGTFELWFRPDELTKKYILIDSGSSQPGTGLSLRLNGTQLEYSVYTGTKEAIVTADISSELATSDFVQFVGTVRLNAGVASIEMIVNGVSVGTASEAGFTAWSDISENLALGNIQGSATVFGVSGGDPFDGEISNFRFYDTPLTSTQALVNFNAVAGTRTGITVTSTDTATDGTRGLVTVSANGALTYDPNAQFETLAAGATATDSFRYTVSDGNGNTDTARVTLTISGVNDAPVLAAVSRSLGSILANATSTAMTVNSLLGASVSDVDTGALRGIAVTGTTGTGTWQYSTNGTTWVNFGSVGLSSSLLLSSTDQIRFVGSGTLAGSATITYAAWDQSIGTAGAKVDLGGTGRGGTTAWSTGSDTATLTLNRVNLAPTANSDSYILDEDGTFVSNAGWFNSQWTMRQRLTFNNGSGAVLTNQAVLITLNGSTIDYGKTLNNGQDLRFVDGDGALLDYEIESWDESGTSRVWVLVPQIDSVSNTDFVWMYYGNALAANVQNSGAVWNDQEAVLHLNGTPVDSSSNAISVTTSGAVPIAGISAGARDFDGTNDFIRLAPNTEVNNIFQNGGTVSAWINPDGWGGGGFGRIADKASTTFGSNGIGWALQVTPAGAILFEHGFSSAAGRWTTSGGDISQTGGWYHVVLVYDASTPATDPKIYINGTQVAVIESQTPSGAIRDDSSVRLTIGNHAAATSRTFDGAIDEFRASRTSATAAQVLADYRSMTGALTTIGMAETGPGGVLINDTDPDGDSLSVASWTNPTRSKSFTMNSNGTFTYTPQDHFNGTDSFTYRLTDGTNVLAPVTVTLNVRSINDAPSAITLSSHSIAGYTDGAVVGGLTVTDVDTGDTHTLTVSDSRFEIVSGQLKLRAGQQINPVVEPTVTLEISATDTSGASRLVMTTLTTIDINTSPALSVISLTPSISENVLMTTPIHVASISISDDGIGTNTLSLSGDNAAYFELVGQDLYLRAGAIFDHETTSTLDVRINVDDPDYAGAPDDSKVFSLVITDVNELPSLNLSSVVTSVAENSNATTFVRVADIVINDDALGTNLLTLSGADAALFTVAGNGLYINTSTLLDFEARTSLSVDLHIDDSEIGGTPDSTLSLVLSVMNVNEAPIAVMNGSYIIAEGQDLVLNASGSSDPDGDVLTYEWHLDGDNFVPDATGINPTLTWAQLIANNPPVNDDGARNIQLKVTDSAGLSTMTTTTLTVTNTAPTISVAGNATVDSGATYVLSLSSSDPGHDRISSWSINWGDGTPVVTVDGSLSSASHVYLTPGGTHSITVSGNDEDGTYAMSGGPFIVSVNNTAPFNLVMSDRRVTEGISGASVGMITFTDPDFGDRHTIIVNDPRFEIVGGELRLKADQSLSYASENTISVNITVTDLNGAFCSDNFVLTVNRIAQGSSDSYDVDGTQQLSLSNPSMGVLSNDADPENDALTAVLENGPSNAAAFGMNSDGTFWYRAIAGFSGVDTFTYFVNDGESNSSPVTVTLMVNQPATLNFVQDLRAIDENTMLATRRRIGQFFITDDGIGSNTVSLDGADAAFFELDSFNNLYLRAGVNLDYEAHRRLLVTGQVNDASIAGEPDAVRNVILTVRNVNETPATTGIGSVSINEDAGLQTLNLANSFSDPDQESLRYSFSIVSQTTGLLSSVSINATTGVLRFRSASNAFGTAVLRVTATDAAGDFASAQFTLNVLSVNDAPVVMNYSGSTISGQPLTTTVPGVLLGASDVESSSITAVLIQSPGNGTVVLRPDGSFTYTPTTGFFGTDSFQFAASDGQTTGLTRTASIFVQAPLVGSGSSAATVTTSSATTASASSGTSTGTTGSVAASTPSSPSASSGSTSAPAGYAVTGNSSSSSEEDSLLTAGVVAMNNADEGDVAGFLPPVQTPEVDGGRKIVDATPAGPVGTDRESMRRYSFGEMYSKASGTPSQLWDTDTALTPQELQRQQFYRELAARADEQIDSFEKKLSRNVRMEGRVVGSVGVVTTGFSVGYLIWAVRGGMLLSGVLSQIPAWTMLDPLMVIDGEGRDDDKESLQTIMDREQARLNKTTPPAKT